MTAAVHTVFVSKPRQVPPQPRVEKEPAFPAVAVNGAIIEASAIAREMQHHPAASPAEAWHAAVRALVVRKLLLQRAEALGIEAPPITDAAGRSETEEEALIRALIEEEVKTPEPDEQTCRRYFRQNKASFRSPAVYEASHILFAARKDDPAAFEHARTRAALALDELRASTERFAEIARLHSDCPSGAQGGNLGQVTAGQVTPEFEKALESLAPGEITPHPVETRYGVHIIALHRTSPARELPYELVAGRIADYLRDAATQSAMAQYMARLISAATIAGVNLRRQ